MPAQLTTIYIDMNSYFASVEQQFRPELRGKPVAVVPLDSDSTCCIAASYEAKKFGVRTGTNVGQAKRMCPALICVQGNFERYIKTHHDLIAAIDTQIPVQGVHSIDEMSARLLGDEREPARAMQIARGIKAAIRERIGDYTTCSIGIAPNRFLAKIAADMHKPDGLTMIEPHELPHKLFSLELIDLPGIGKKMKLRLERAGLTTVEQLCTLDEESLARAWGSVIGREWYLRLRGHDVNEGKVPQRTIGHSHVLGPEKRNPDGARAVGMRLANKVAARARHLGYVAEHLWLSVRYRPAATDRDPGSDKKWEGRVSLGSVNDTPTIVGAFTDLWSQCSAMSALRNGKPAFTPVKLAVTLTELTTQSAAAQPLFGGHDKLADLSKAMDAISRKFGADAVYQAAMQPAKRSAPRRIAFGNIPDLDLPDIQA
ncbi:MAG: hypothetical protein AMXMBFR58_28180 [Phycisphaerae bacterium]